MNLTFLNNKDKKKLIEQLDKFGITSLPFHLIQTGKEKIRAFSGEITGEDIMNLYNNLQIEGIGLQILNLKDEDGIRITLDGLHVLKPTKNIIELIKEQAEQWMRGNDLIINEEKSFIILKYKEDLIGMGKSTGNKILNFLPKERRIKN